MKLLSVVVSVAWVAVALGQRGKGKGSGTPRFCSGSSNPVLLSRKNLYCVKSFVEKRYSTMEKEYNDDYEAKLKRCFDDVGKGECGWFGDVLADDVFSADSDQRNPSICSGCDSAWQFLTGNYFVSSKRRDCMNQFFLDMITSRTKQCTKVRTPLIDTDAAALDYKEDLYKSVAQSMAWRHALDVCGAKGKDSAAANIRQCMQEEPRLTNYCRVHDRCYRRRYSRCSSGNTPRVAAKGLLAKKKICGCFNANRAELMSSLKSVADKISAKAVIDGYGTPECLADAQKLMGPMAAKNNDNWEVDWLDVIGPATQQCGANLPMPPSFLLVELPCGDIKNGPHKTTGFTPIQSTLYFISNFASALVDRMVRFCRC